VLLGVPAATLASKEPAVAAAAACAQAAIITQSIQVPYPQLLLDMASLLPPLLGFPPEN
jgi:hypothetical protein